MMLDTLLIKKFKIIFKTFILSQPYKMSPITMCCKFTDVDS